MLFLCSAADESAIAGFPQDQLEKSEGSSCRSKLQKLGRFAVGLSAGLLVTSFIPPLSYQIDAALKDAKHLGHGIYFQWEEVEALTDPEIQTLLESPDQNWKLITEYYTEQLNGDYFKEPLCLMPSPRRASSFFKGQSENRGVCRHKAIILAEILNHVGIEAQLQVGIAQNFESAHMWVYLPKYKTVADPSKGSVSLSHEFYADFFEDPQQVESFWREASGFNNWKLTPFEKGWFY